MYIDKLINIATHSIPLFIIIDIIVGFSIINYILIFKLDKLEFRSKGKTKYRTSDLWFDFLEEKKLKDIEIHEDDFAGYVSALNIIVVPNGTFSKRNLVVKFIVFHEAMHYYCNHYKMFTHRKITKIINGIGLSIQLGFIPYLILKSILLDTPIYHISWIDISILLLGWALNSIPLLIEEAFVSYHSYKYITKRVTMKKEYKNEMKRFALYAWLSHLTATPIAVVEEVSRWISIYYHKRANKAVLAEKNKKDTSN